MTILIPMRTEVFASYLKLVTKLYAHELITSGLWPDETALERSQAELGSMLPEGINTPDSHFFEIMEPDSNVTLGYLWFTVQEQYASRSAFLCNITIKEEYRRQGHAKRALLEFESIATTMGISGIGLHVFAHMDNAQALYRQLGYAASGIHMWKNVAP